jgi:hypothetical protein
MPADRERDYQDALQTVEPLANVKSAEPHERKSSSVSGTRWRTWLASRAGRVDIAVFGEVSSGKSALIRRWWRYAPPSASGGWTKEVGEWRGVPHIRSTVPIAGSIDARSTKSMTGQAGLRSKYRQRTSFSLLPDDLNARGSGPRRRRCQ